MKMTKDELLYSVLYFLVFSMVILVKGTFKIRTTQRDKYVNAANILIEELQEICPFLGKNKITHN